MIKNRQKNLVFIEFLKHILEISEIGKAESDGGIFLSTYRILKHLKQKLEILSNSPLRTDALGDPSMVG